MHKILRILKIKQVVVSIQFEKKMFFLCFPIKLTCSRHAQWVLSCFCLTHVRDPLFAHAGAFGVCGFAVRSFCTWSCTEFRSVFCCERELQYYTGVFLCCVALPCFVMLHCCCTCRPVQFTDDRMPGKLCMRRSGQITRHATTSDLQDTKHGGFITKQKNSLVKQQALCLWTQYETPNKTKYKKTDLQGERSWDQHTKNRTRVRTQIWRLAHVSNKSKMKQSQTPEQKHAPLGVCFPW